MKTLLSTSRLLGHGWNFMSFWGSDVEDVLLHLDWVSSTMVQKVDAMFAKFFTKLSRLFVNQFVEARHPKKPVTHLLLIKQNEEETLKEYIARFNLKAVQVEGYSDDVALIAMMTKLQTRRFLWSIMKNPPHTYIELLNNAYKYTNARTLQCEKK
ncbi:hypothetical protein Q3G72_009345 [Acer saccharum]|nr:hypothetical protein Q3G72_009345 [Acer saccharum]